MIPKIRQYLVLTKDMQDIKVMLTSNSSTVPYELGAEHYYPRYSNKMNIPLAYSTFIISILPYFNYEGTDVYEATVTIDENKKYYMVLERKLTKDEIEKAAKEEAEILGIPIMDLIFIKNPNDITPPAVITQRHVDLVNAWSDIFLSSDENIINAFDLIELEINTHIAYKMRPVLEEKLRLLGLEYTQADLVNFLNGKRFSLETNVFNVYEASRKCITFMDEVIKSAIKNRIISPLKPEDLIKSGSQAYMNKQLCKDSMNAFINARITKFFPVSPTWQDKKSAGHKNIFQPAIDLWDLGIVPCYYYGAWNLLGGPNLDIL